MIQGIGILFLIFTAVMVMLSRKETGLRRYRAIHWLVRQGKRKGWYRPEWIN